MPRSWDSRPDRGLGILLQGIGAALSVLFVLLFLLVAYRRLHYPFEVDRMESGMLTSVWRLRQGYALYTPPSMEWAPFLYAPLFFYVAAAVTKGIGVQYAALRLISIAATLGSFALIFSLVLTETRRRWAPALFAVGLFASLYPFVLAWYDVGRVDSLSLFFFLAALWSTRRSQPVLAAVLWWLAFLTKQTFLPLGLAMFLVEWQRPRRMLSGMAAYAVLVLASVVWLQRATHGWFAYYAFGTAGVIKWSFHTAVMFPFADLLGPLPIACGFIAVGALFTGVRWRERDGGYFAIVTLLVTGAIWYVRAHVGANVNAIIPLYAWLSVLAGVALDRLLQSAWTAQDGIKATPTTEAVVPAVLWLLACAQLGAHLYRPAEIQTGNLGARLAFLTALRHTPGDVWVVDHSYDAILAGKPLHADMDALDAVLGRKYEPALEQFDRLVAHGALTAVVLDRAPAAYEPRGLFTDAPFGTTYRVRAVAPGGGAPGELDQPLFTLLPCAAVPVPNSLTDLQATLADRSGCATK